MSIIFEPVSIHAYNIKSGYTMCGVPMSPSFGIHFEWKGVCSHCIPSPCCMRQKAFIQIWHVSLVFLTSSQLSVRGPIAARSVKEKLYMKYKNMTKTVSETQICCQIFKVLIEFLHVVGAFFDWLIDFNNGMKFKFVLFFCWRLKRPQLKISKHILKWRTIETKELQRTITYFD